MNTEYIYKEQFEYAKDKLRQFRDNKMRRYENKEDLGIKRIFNCGDDKYGMYSNIVTQVENYLIQVVREILYKLLDEYEIEYNYYLSLTENNESIERYVKNRHGCPVAYIINENDKRIGYILYDEINHDEIINEGRVDEIRYIHLTEYSDEAYKILIYDKNRIYQKNNIPVSQCTLKDFFERYFSTEEYSIFQDYAYNFNSEANTIISLSTVVSPTEWAIKRFKLETLEELKTFDYESRAKMAGIYDNTVSRMIDNYINKGLYKIFAGNEKFAESFISAEWNRKMQILTEDLDLTGVVVGYLKSIEQLLYFISNYYVSQGTQIKLTYSTRHNTDSCYYTEQIDARKTLGWLKTFAINNPELTIVSDFVKRYTEEKISDFGNDKRNPLSHKEIIKKLDEVKEIRDETVYLFFLIVGELRFTDEDIERLLMDAGIEDELFHDEGM